MSNTYAIVEGNYVLTWGPNRSDLWLADDGAATEVRVRQRVTNGAALVVDGRIVDMFLTREGAERSLDPEYQAALNEAKRRSGVEWA